MATEPIDYRIPTSDHVARDLYDEASFTASFSDCLYNVHEIPSGMSLGILALDNPWQDRSEAQEFLFWREGRHARHEWLQYTDDGLVPVQMLGSALLDGAILEPGVLKRNMSFFFNRLDTVIVGRQRYSTMSIRQTGPVVDYVLRTTLEPYPL